MDLNKITVASYDYRYVQVGVGVPRKFMDDFGKRSKRRLDNIYAAMEKYLHSNNAQPKKYNIINTYEAKMVHEKAASLGLKHKTIIDQDNSHKIISSMFVRLPDTDNCHGWECECGRCKVETTHIRKPNIYVEISKEFKSKTLFANSTDTGSPACLTLWMGLFRKSHQIKFSLIYEFQSTTPDARSWYRGFGRRPSPTFNKSRSPSNRRAPTGNCRRQLHVVHQHVRTQSLHPARTAEQHMERQLPPSERSAFTHSFRRGSLGQGLCQFGKIRHCPTRKTVLHELQTAIQVERGEFNNCRTSPFLNPSQQ